MTPKLYIHIAVARGNIQTGGCIHLSTWLELSRMVTLKPAWWGIVFAREEEKEFPWASHRDGCEFLRRLSQRCLCLLTASGLVSWRCKCDASTDNSSFICPFYSSVGKERSPNQIDNKGCQKLPQPKSASLKYTTTKKQVCCILLFYT